MVLVLLLSLMGLTIGLSTASRSLSDLKQVAYVDSGTKAFAACEAGLQYALSVLDTSAVTDCNYHPTGLNLSSVNVSDLSYKVCTATANTVVISNIAKDDVAQISLGSINPNTKTFNFFWKGASSLEIIRLDKDNLVTRYAYNPSGSALTNSFSAGFAASDSSNCPAACAVSGYDYCSGDVPYVNLDKFLRIKSLYGATPVTVCALTAGKSRVNMPTDYTTVEAKTTMVDGTVKRCQVVKTPPTLPAIFDYAIFSRGAIVKN